MHMEEGIYISDYVFTCSGVIQTYSLTVFQHSAVENEFWEDTLTTTVDIVGVRTGTTQPVQLGQIQVQMNHPDDDHEHQAKLAVITGNLTQEIFIQQGDYVRITTPRALYNLNEGQFINQHIPVAMVPSAEHNITRYYDCSDEMNCNRMEILPLQAAISFTVDTQGEGGACFSTAHTHTHNYFQTSWHVCMQTVMCTFLAHTVHVVYIHIHPFNVSEQHTTFHLS